MKTLSNVFFILTIVTVLMLTDRAEAYLVTVNKPCKYEIVATRQFYPQHTVDVEYRVDSVNSLNVHEAIIRIYARQGANEILLHQDFIEIQQWRSVTVDVSLLPNIKYNEPITIKVVASNPGNPLVTGTGKGYVLIYREGLNNEILILRNGTSQVTMTGFCNFANNYNCHALPNGIYHVKQNKMDFVLNGDFDNYKPVVIPELCNGFSGACPNSQRMWGYKYFQSSTQAKFMTFVYTNIYNTAGQLLPDQPCSPEESVIAYKKVYKIILGPFTQYPNPVAPPNHTVYVYANLLQGNGDISYEWQDTNRPQGVEFIPDGNKVKINYPVTGGMSESSPPHKIRLRCHNEFGSTEWKYYQVNRTGSISLCPLLNFTYDRHTFSENPLLNSSKNGDVDVTEHYKINYKEINSGEDINFNIEESGEDQTLIDHVAMKRATCKSDEEIAVTSKGEIINFTKGINYTATLNLNDDVSEVLRENDNDFLTMKAGERVKIVLNNKGKIPSHISMLVRFPVLKYDIGGLLQTGNMTDTFFVKNNESVVCIKLKADQSTEGFYYIEAAQPFQLDKVELVNNRNTAKITELDLQKASHNFHGNMLDRLSLEDQIYADLGKSENIEFTFGNNVSTSISNKSTYILSIRGKVLGENSNNKPAIDQASKNLLRLNGNFPEPFNPTTTISFQTPSSGNVSMKVFDITGRLISELINEYRTPGNYTVNFDGSNLASGVYFYRLDVPSGYLIRKMTLIK